MLLRRALPLTLAALVMATGCVTVHPPAPSEPRLPATAAARTVFPQPTVPAMPLGTLPAASEPASAAPPPAHDPVPDAARPQRAKPEKHTPAKPVQAKPRPRKPGAAKGRPAPRRTYDMAPLCAAARGTVSPDILALCR
ncbi:hypothetical protein ACFV9E_10340 [Streptomyces sp. NPDC059835]|uniref:hypothetical protein n=1 Tax=Streptomyces sp. NPDC059835 TaxID=3346967 RepID=UPI003661F41D